MKGLSDVAAASLAEHKWGLSLGSLENISNGTLGILCSYKGGIFNIHLPSFDEEAEEESDEEE